ncbi:hypothetical protein FocnCong_v011003 [Fusarium oxysporum f. sp. conglutinans]|nr:hypothetical protein FocnCong_v011003 [Fusarium oxysporum f. sp. conglutinans]
MEECHSPSQLAGRTTTSQSGADPTSDTCYQSLEHPDTAASSASSPPPIYGESMDISCSSTPSGDISTPSDYNEGTHPVKPSAEHALLPQFQKDGFFVAPDNGLERRPDLKAGNSYYAWSPPRPGPAWIPRLGAVEQHWLDACSDGTLHGAWQRAVYRVGEPLSILSPTTALTITPYIISLRHGQNDYR